MEILTGIFRCIRAFRMRALTQVLQLPLQLRNQWCWNHWVNRLTVLVAGRPSSGFFDHVRFAGCFLRALLESSGETESADFTYTSSQVLSN